jgi:hypothetical protein
VRNGFDSQSMMTSSGLRRPFDDRLHRLPDQGPHAIVLARVGRRGLMRIEHISLILDMSYRRVLAPGKPLEGM